MGGEIAARALLEQQGFEVIGYQVPMRWYYDCDGEPCASELRADYVVERQGARYVAEVKTGRLAPQLSHGPTRRQLLEYQLAYEVDGVLLVDVEDAWIQQVNFVRSRTSSRGVAAFAWGSLFGVLLTLLALWAWLTQPDQASAGVGASPGEGPRPAVMPVPAVGRGSR